jgi:hypothetical protein
MALMFSSTSDRRCAGFLEGMDGVAQNPGLEQRLQGSAIHDVRRTAQEVVDVQLQSGVLEDAHGQRVIEFYEDVNVAFGASFATGDGAEDCGVRHSKTPQVRLMRPQSFEDLIEILHDVSRRVYQTGLLGHVVASSPRGLSWVDPDTCRKCQGRLAVRDRAWRLARTMALISGISRRGARSNWSH